MDDVKSDIDADIRAIDEATDKLKTHREQLHVLEKLAELKESRYV